MGRRKKNFDKMPAGFDAGTFDRIDQAIAEAEWAESRKDFLRQAVEHELQLAEREMRRRARSRKKDQGS